ncbi:Type I restriction-modification system, specificity subunit S [Candidatus Nitrotoga sp. HW29]|uniref:restriction endonuclease subunit S n=1 Tax=Candidatus Nitrotoga sp. HW29 TaxID=2886963 RepID=UPI001EF27389|nr:restriction endonuclease subunit S [Candidatus Nitrotoga sp. HW29]CAH1905367.1 Type I restriction-modification system, specificity subunit S [Candidatus Nitrotoga sp. HW29]
MSSRTTAQAATIGDIAFESKVRADAISESGLRVYGVDRTDGLTPDAKYTSKDLGRYKVLRPGMFAYNPMRLNIGSIAYCTDKHAVGLVSPDYVVFGCKPGILDPDYFSYAIKGPEWRQWTTAAGVGSVRVRIYFRELAKMQITLLPLPEQKAIAHILGTLDDKIELIRRMNSTLEAMARALFQSWFVDFDPVRAKLDGRKPSGLDAATAALFPAHFQDSSLGHIPQGWKLGVLNDLIDTVVGGDWGSSEPSNEENLPTFCIRGADIPSLQEGGIGKMPTRFLKRSSLEKRSLSGGDLAIEISGGSPTQSTGRPVLVSENLLQRLKKPLVCSNFCRIVKLKSPATSKFVYLWLRLVYENGEIFQFENGTTGIKNFAFTLFAEKNPLVIPPPELCEAFDRVVSPILEQHQANGIQSSTLSALRDTLLPKLLSGKLSVAKATSELEAVT